MEGRGGELWSVRYPGRESRLGEPLMATVSGLVDELVPPLTRLLADRIPTVLLGHSLGVGVAAHAAARITDESPDSMSALPLLVLSAREAPSTPARTRDQHLRALSGDDHALWEWLRSLDGLPRELLEDADYRAMQLPILRADLLASLADDVLPRTRGGPLNVPLLLTCGDEDPVVPLSAMTDWRELTGADTHHLEISGGHHAILTDASPLLDEIHALLKRVHTAPESKVSLTR